MISDVWEVTVRSPDGRYTRILISKIEQESFVAPRRNDFATALLLAMIQADAQGAINADTEGQADNNSERGDREAQA